MYKPSSHIRFRSQPLTASPGGVDRDASMLRGISVAEPMEATGHALIFDGVSIQQLIDLGNKTEHGIKSRFTHPGLSADGLGKFLGRAKDFRLEGGRALADLHISNVSRGSPDGDLGGYIMDRAEEDPNSFGMSVVVTLTRVWIRPDGVEIEADERAKRPADATTKYPVARIIQFHAADAVDEPALNGSGLFSRALVHSNQLAEQTFQQIDEYLSFHDISPQKALGFVLNYLQARGLKGDLPMSTINFDPNLPMPESVAVPPGSGLSNPPSTGVDEQQGHAAAWLQAMSEAAKAAMLSSSDLPPLVQQRLRATAFEGPEELKSAIVQARREVAALSEDRVVDLPGPPSRGVRLTGMMAGYEEFEKAFGSLLSGQSLGSDVRPLTGIREAYLLLSGDYEMTGLFHPDRVAFANVNSSTMANLVANAMNKVVANQFQSYPRWWENFIHEEDFGSLQDVQWTTLGGVGELPTVAEGASYAELTWDDEKQTSAFIKKGGYLGITLEAVDKDDTRRLRAAPRALAQAAWLTLGKSISSIFTQATGTGPTLSDSKALFHTDHANLGTTVLSWAAWDSTRTAMRKQTEVNSGERLGALTSPRYLLVPPDLETTALQILASGGEPGTGDNDENPFAQGDDREARFRVARRQVRVIDLWTDTNNWAAVADPLLYPSLGVGYRFGRQPEVFSVASPTAGLMFTADTMPVKVRWFYAVGVIDYRGLYKHNVA